MTNPDAPRIDWRPFNEWLLETTATDARKELGRRFYASIYGQSEWKGWWALWTRTERALRSA